MTATPGRGTKSSPAKTSLHKWLLISLLLAAGPVSGATPDTYLVRDGDSVVSILLGFGYGESYQEILPFIDAVVSANPGAFRRGDPDLLYPGAILALPENPNDPPPAPAPQPEPEPEPEPEPAIPVIGEVEVSAGSASIRRGADTVAVPRRQDLHAGDVILTGAGAQAAIRLRDETVFTVGPDSEFALERFRLQREQGGGVLGELLATLRLGVLRTVTGLLGRTGRGDFEVRSVMTATIGIRGTDFTMRACTDAAACGDLFGASVAVREGGIAFANQGGGVDLDQGEFALVDSPEALPEKGPIPEGFFDLQRNVADIAVDKPWWQRSIDAIRGWF